MFSETTLGHGADAQIDDHNRFRHAAITANEVHHLHLVSAADG